MSCNPLFLFGTPGRLGILQRRISANPNPAPWLALYHYTAFMI